MAFHRNLFREKVCRRTPKPGKSFCVFCAFVANKIRVNLRNLWFNFFYLFSMVSVAERGVFLCLCAFVAE